MRRSSDPNEYMWNDNVLPPELTEDEIFITMRDKICDSFCVEYWDGKYKSITTQDIVDHLWFGWGTKIDTRIAMKLKPFIVDRIKYHEEWMQKFQERCQKQSEQ